MAERRLPIGNLMFKIVGAVCAIPLLPQARVWLQQASADSAPAGGACSTWPSTSCWRCVFIGLTGVAGAWLRKLFAEPTPRVPRQRPQHLDPSALATPIAGHQLRGARGAAPGRRGRDHAARHRCRCCAATTSRWPSSCASMDDTVDELYSAIKLYLTQISREALSERESRRWTDVVSFTINMEQIGDIIERVLQDIEDKKIRPNRSFSDAGMGEICHLHERLLANLRLAMSVFLDGHVRDAREAARREGALSRPAARVRGQPHRAAAGQTPRRASRPVRCTWT